MPHTEFGDVCRSLWPMHPAFQSTTWMWNFEVRLVMTGFLRWAHKCAWITFSQLFQFWLHKTKKIANEPLKAKALTLTKETSVSRLCVSFLFCFVFLCVCVAKITARWNAFSIRDTDAVWACLMKVNVSGYAIWVSGCMCACVCVCVCVSM